MRAAKFWYAAYFAALACIFPFLNLFFRRLGLDEQRIGLLGAVRPFVSMPAGSLWSGAADKWRRHRAVLVLTLCASVLARLSLAAAGRLGFAPLLATVAATEFFAAPVTILADAAVMAACGEQGNYGRQRLWGAVGWGIMAAVSGSAISRCGIWAAFAGHAALAAVALAPTLRLPFGPLHARLDKQGGARSLDGGGAEHAGNPTAPQQAPGGRLGAAAAVTSHSPRSPSSGGGKGQRVRRFDSALEQEALLARRPSSPPPNNKPAGRPQTAEAADRSPSLSSPRPPSSPPRHGGGPPQVHYWRGVAQLLRNPEAAIFFFMATVMGFGVGNIEGYLFLFLEELGGSELLMGLSLTVTCAAETAVFAALPALLRLGIRACLHLVLAAFLLRMACYAALAAAPSPWLVLPVEVLHGFTFALAWGGGSAYCAQLAPPGLEATTQGLFQGLYFGLGVGLGSLCGGYVYLHHGAQAVYLAACAVLLAGWVLCCAAQLAVARLGLGERGSYARVAEADGDLEMNELSHKEQASQS